MKRSLTQSQASELMRAASTLVPAAREQFLAAVDARLCSLPHRLNDGDVAATIVSVLANVTPTSHFMCDAARGARAMARQNYEIVDRVGNPVDDDILPDGGRLRVPMMARDGLSDIQRGVIEDKMCRFDDSAARHQPGPVYYDRSAAMEAYERAKAEAQDAWRTPSAPAADHAVTEAKTDNMNDREVARVHDTGDPVRDAYLDGITDLTSSWQRR